MFRIFKGVKPDLTPAQAIGVLITGVPVVSKLLAAFDVITLTAIQQAALTDALTWAAIASGVLFVADAGIRAARNQAAAKRDAAVLLTPAAQPATAPAPTASEIAVAVTDAIGLQRLEPAFGYPQAPGGNAIVSTEIKGTAGAWGGPLSEPPDSTPVEPVATPVEGAEALPEGLKAEGLVSDADEFASPPPPLGTPADPDGKR